MRSKKRSKFRFSLRVQLILLCLFLAFSPIIVVFPIGFVDRLYRDETIESLEERAQDFLDIADQHQLDLNTLSPDEPWIHEFSQDHFVMIRIMDRDGRIKLTTDHLNADWWSRIRTVWLGLEAFFFGPVGPPNLLAFESELPPLSERPEVQAALIGRGTYQFRYDQESRLFVYSLAVPIEGNRGVVYLTRSSRRVVRSLYDSRFQMLKLSLFLCLIALFVGVIVGRRFVNPLSKMGKTITSYRMDFDPALLASLSLQRNDELGDLSRSFQELAVELHEQSKRRTSVAGDLAHDLKNPIATIAASADLLESSSEIDESRKLRIAHALSTAASHMNRSVEGLLSLSRLDELLASQQRSPQDLVEISKEVLETYRNDPRWEKISIQFQHDKQPHILYCDQQNIEKLLRNLFENAFTFCRSEVFVSLSKQDNNISLTVSDDGPGVSEGNRDKIFQRFFTSRPQDLPQGSGLGLSIVESIAISHGGQVRLLETDKTPLPGATFEVEFPEFNESDQ